MIRTHGRTFTGIVVSDKMNKTVTVQWERKTYIQKYERYAKKRTKVKAHNPEEIDARVGDKVRIMETRPLSKTKHFIIIEKITASQPEEKIEKIEKTGETVKTPKETPKKAVKKVTKKVTKKAVKKTQ